jgi:hypothetical protein
MVAFTWLRTSDGGISSVPEGVRLLDTAAPGDNLAAAKLIVPSGADAAGPIESALIAPDGREVIVAALRDLSPQSDRHTFVVQFAELQVGSGRLVRVLRTQTVGYSQDPFINMQDGVGVLSLGSQGQYALVQGIQFGWLDVGGPDPGQFAPLPAPPVDYVDNFGIFAAW